MYISGHVVYSFGMLMLALSRHRVAVILLSCTAGIMYATLFTMPYLLVAHYHTNHMVSATDLFLYGSLLCLQFLSSAFRFLKSEM